jgi:hypothetical protein
VVDGPRMSMLLCLAVGLHCASTPVGVHSWPATDATDSMWPVKLLLCPAHGNSQLLLPFCCAVRWAWCLLLSAPHTVAGRLCWEADRLASFLQLLQAAVVWAAPDAGQSP